MIGGELANRAQRLAADRVGFVVATVVRAQRPTSVHPGDTALVLADGTIEGFVGGHCAQAAVRLHAARVLETGEPLLLRLVPEEVSGRAIAREAGDACCGDERLVGGAHAAGRHADACCGDERLVGGAHAAGAADAWSVVDGAVVAHHPCLSGGALDVFLEPQLPAPRMAIVGEAPIALALERLAAAAGYAVERGTAADVRPRSDDAACVVASHGSGEEVALAAALTAGVPYVALVASDRRGAAVRASLDVPSALRSRLHVPAGLAIGARTPVEVAISILAQLVAEQRTHPGELSRTGDNAPVHPAARTAERAARTADDPTASAAAHTADDPTASAAARTGEHPTSPAAERPAGDATAR